jgi:predicted dehydrogenase
VVDINAPRAKEIAKRYRTQPFFHHSELLDRVQAVSIAVPTPVHHSIAKDFLLRGIDVLLEKPITRTLEEADELIELAESKGLILQVGHLERFNGAMLALEGRIQNPMFIESNRLGPFLTRGTDVDVVLDLMIHDIDIILSWVKAKVIWLHAVGIPVLTSHIDIANVRMQFENGCTVNLTASRVSREKTRKIRIFQPNGYFSIDFLSQKAFYAGKKDSSGEEGLPGIIIKKIRVKKVDPLNVEIRSFLECVSERKTPRVSGREGKRSLEVALQIAGMIEDLISRYRR